MNMLGAGGSSYYLADQPMKSGGEGSIYQITNAPGKVAKIYKKDHVSRELEEKLTYMVHHPPNARVISQMAWPLDLLYEAGRFVGFVMPKLDAAVSLKSFYEYPQINYQHLTTAHRAIIAENICVVVDELHRAGYVFGDFNPNNIGVSPKTGEVSFFDVDTYQFRDPVSGHTYRCMGGFDGYVAPELLWKLKVEHKGFGQVSLPSFTAETDNFALAIHVFRLLMNGFTPFCGIPVNATNITASPGVGHKAVEQGNYCFKQGFKPYSPAMPSADTLTPELLRLCEQAFLTGNGQRPTPMQWRSALGKLQQEWRRCDQEPTHYYRNALRSCPYCDADQRMKKAANPGLVQRQMQNVQYNLQNVQQQVNNVQRQFQNPPQPVTQSNVQPGGRRRWRQPRKGVHWIWILLFILFARMIVNSVADAYTAKKERELKEVQDQTEQMMLDRQVSEHLEYEQTKREEEAAEAERAANPTVISGDLFGGTLLDNSQIDYYTYQAPRTGMYRFDCFLKNSMNNGYYLYLWGPDDRHMETEFYREGISAELQEGETYRLEVRAATIREACDYRVKINVPNQVQTVDAGGNAVSGETTYQDQEDWFEYRSVLTGTWIFCPESSNPEGYYQYSVFDSSGGHLGSASSGQDLLVDLEVGETYQIRVRQTKGFTNYKVTFTCQR